MEKDLNITQMEQILDNIIKLVIDEQNRILTTPFSDEEIKHSILIITHNKALSLNCFPIEFFQRY